MHLVSSSPPSEATMTIYLQANQPYQEALCLYEQQRYCAAQEVLQQAITIDCEDVALLSLHALVLGKQKRYQQQLICLERLLELAPNQPQFILQKAYAYFETRDYSKAKSLVMMALKVKGAVGNEDMIAGVKLLHMLGLYDIALEALAVGDITQVDLNHLHLLAQSQVQCGQGKAASIIYQHLLERNSECSKSMIGLTLARKASANNNNVKALTKLVKQTRNPWLGINICHALAKELDELGEYQQAYEVLRRGKKRLRSASPFEPKHSVDNINQLLSVYQEKLVAPFISDNASNHAPIFVVGMPRTGTTIVERLLTNHPDIASVGERPQFSALLKQQCGSGYAGLVDSSALSEHWDTIDFTELGHQYIESIDYIAQGKRCVDKLPLNILLVGAIIRALPQAKIVCLTRDPLDTVIGNYKQGFEYATDTYSYSLDLVSLSHFVLGFRNLARYFATHFPKQFMTLDYRQLVSSASDSAQSLFKFCALDWQDSYLAIHKNTAPIGTASAIQVQQPIHQQSIGKSKNYAFCTEPLQVLFDQEST